jgi:peptidoglycan/xylan/chitin deacetylase (PgdA/CDA1 family)
MRAEPASVPVLTFHSISNDPGSTSISAETFRMQMDVLAECGVAAMTCEEFLDWHRGGAPGGGRRVLITFDDGFADFATAAHPVLRERGFAAMVFVPTGKLDYREDWRGANDPPRRLLDWSTVRELAAAGVEFGGHGVAHADLTRVPPPVRRHEIERSARELEQQLGRPVRAFAAPYGRVNRDVLADVARTYEIAFGTRFGRALPARDPYDVPRIEMHYFRSPRRWREFIDGATGYFEARRVLRAVRLAAMRVMDPAGVHG